MSSVTLVTETMGAPDVDACWKLDQLCFEGTEAYDRQTIRDLLSSSETVCFKSMTSEDVLVGFAVGVVEPEFRGHVVVLGVSPDFRRLGVATELMRHLEGAFRMQSVHLVHLEVRTTNDGARALYEGLGFRVAGRRLGYYTNGDDGFLMVKTLLAVESATSASDSSNCSPRVR